MNSVATHFRVWYYLVTLLAISILSACQVPQPRAQCCELKYGLLQPADLNGQWELAEAQTQVIQPITSRYSKYPAIESARQYLSGYLDGHGKVNVIIHDMRRYTNLAPSLGKLDFALDRRDAGIQILPPKLPQVGLDHQIQCLASNSSDPKNSIIVCNVEVRYQHILSTMFFYFDGLTSGDDIETLINQALEKTDVRIEEIDQHLSNSDG